ncbi:MAG: macro domain-containing protein, partial [Dehalococcoidia bacterium]
IVARQGRLPTGKAVITTGGNLKAKYVIHTVGPIWHGGNKGEPELLTSAYQQSLKIAAEKSINSVSFPSISTGAYGYPVGQASEVALDAVITFLSQRTASLREVVFVLFDSRTFGVYSSALREMAGKRGLPLS